MKPLEVHGHELTAGGKKFIIHGLNIPSLEWTAKGDHVLESVRVATRVWHANFLRIPLNQDRWFGKAPDNLGTGGIQYRKLVHQVVDEAQKNGAYVLLDLHWSDGGVWGQNIGQHNLPDENSRQFWHSCATNFANRGSVVFDLYNEPIKGPWSAWQNGGRVSEVFQGKKLTYQSVGLQTLINVIRETGAKNMVIAGGLGYASDMSGIMTHRLVDKTGHGVLYSNHFYPGWETVDAWVHRITWYFHELPMVLGEFGDDPAMMPLDSPKRRIAQILNIVQTNHWNWVAWCMHPAATPCVIADWTYKPTSYFGALVKRALSNEKVEIPPAPTTHSDVPLYDDKLENSYVNWGNAVVDYSDSTVVHTGNKSMKITYGPNQQILIGSTMFSAKPFKGLSFWLNGGDTGGQRLKVLANLLDTPANAGVLLPALEANKWTHFEISFEQLGISGKEGVKSFAFQNATNDALPPVYLDDLLVMGKK